MTRGRFSGSALAVCGLLAFTPVSRAATFTADVCVYGGTAGGVAAAVQATRMGKSAILLEPGNHIGGLTSGGLGATDIGNKAAIGGISREFYRRLGKHYGPEEQWTFEPGVAERTLRAMLDEAGVKVLFQQRLGSVTKTNRRISSIKMESGAVVRARMFLDATYEGDLMARAGVSYTVGREANAQYGETLNGIRAHTPQHQFRVAVDPYVVPGDPTSGLLPFIQPAPLGQPGDGDHRVQAYNFRLCLTTNVENRLPIKPPVKYDPAHYELLARYLEALVAAGRSPALKDLLLIKFMPNGKTDMNNNGAFSTDFIGMNWDYPTASYTQRAKIWRAHEDYTRGFLHFLATGPRVPAALRAEMQQWGLCKDEFRDAGGWPHQLYVREARRMVSDYVMTEHNCRGTRMAPDSVGLGAYGMDSHNCQRIVRNDRAENEGDVQVHGFVPYPIAYQSIVPRAEECENLLVPICLSATHIAFGSIRMEPVFMILGQSAATAAVLAINQNSSVQKIDLAKLRERLLADGQILEWTPDPDAKATVYLDPKDMPGIVIDDAAAEKTGVWATSVSVGRRIVGYSYSHDRDADKGLSSITFTPDIPSAGNYELVLHAPKASNRASNVPVAITTAGKAAATVTVNQKAGADGDANSLGTFKLPAGKTTRIVISNKGTDGHVVVDALQLLPVK